MVEKFYASRRYSIREQFSHDIAQLVIWCRCKGYGVTKGEAYRTEEQQRIHREGWRFINGKWRRFKKFVRSWVRFSQHQKRLGEDLHIWDEITGANYITDQQWLEVGRKWESLNPMNRWGGRFRIKKQNYNKEIGKDRWHFERKS